MNRELFEAYKNTTYRVYSPIGEIDIRIGQKNDALFNLLERNNTKSWAFVTAFNPFSVNQKDKVNKLLNNQLEEYLNVNEFVFFKGSGIGDDGLWFPEDSFLVLNITKNKAMEIGRQFNQNAIVAGGIFDLPEIIKCFDSNKKNNSANS